MVMSIVNEIMKCKMDLEEALTYTYKFYIKSWRINMFIYLFVSYTARLILRYGRQQLTCLILGENIASEVNIKVRNSDV